MTIRCLQPMSVIDRAPRKKLSSGGFTLLELMVALTIGAMAVTSVYTLGAASSRRFGEQRRISNVQTSLRIAMNHLKRDIARAGYLGSPNAAAPGERCMVTQTPVAISFLDNPATDFQLIDPNDQHGGVQADRIVLTGDYVTRGDYLISGLDNAGTTAYFQSNWQAFRRDFTNWWKDPPAPETINGTDFSAAFQTNRWMRLQNQQGFKFFVPITASGTDNSVPPLAQVTFAGALPIGNPCVGGFMGGAKAAPLSMIRYRLAQAAATGPNAAVDAVIKGNNIQLVREEIDPVNSTNPLDPTQSALMANTRRQTLLDYVVHFDVDFVIDARTRSAGTPPCLVRYDDGLPSPNAAACANVGFAPERIRAAIVTLSARTPEQDPRFIWLARTAGQPLTRYQFNPALPGAARVRTLRAEILVPNVAQPGL
jgi:prepilin-type N-terminal cleavage/methylation domain-containing protein